MKITIMGYSHIQTQKLGQWEAAIHHDWDWRRRLSHRDFTELRSMAATSENNCPVGAEYVSYMREARVCLLLYIYVYVWTQR